MKIGVLGSVEYRRTDVQRKVVSVNGVVYTTGDDEKSEKDRPKNFFSNRNIPVATKKPFPSTLNI